MNKFYNITEVLFRTKKKTTQSFSRRWNFESAGTVTIHKIYLISSNTDSFYLLFFFSRQHCSISQSLTIFGQRKFSTIFKLLTASCLEFVHKYKERWKYS